MKSYICCGMQYGDEGKGSFIDWLTHYTDINCIVKYNGGSQASHTVETPEGITHKFAQLGSGMFKEGCHTYITKDMVVNPDNLLREVELFAEENHESVKSVLSRIHIHSKCLIVTPYHKLINRLRELSLGENRRGSVGTGVSEVPYLASLEEPMSIKCTIGGLYRNDFELYDALKNLQDYARTFYREHKKEILENCPDELRDDMINSLNYFIGDAYSFSTIRNLMEEKHRKANKDTTLAKCLYDYYEDTIRKEEAVIWEGSQGFLIDKEYGIAPNTTLLKTTNEPAINEARLKDEVKCIGITKAFCSRHGRGIFPTEDKFLLNYITDKNQDISYWNGSPRYGWFDAVLFKYANSVNKVGQIFLSSLDKLSGLKEIKICTEYAYEGDVDEEFTEAFEWYSHHDKNGKVTVHVTNIRKNTKSIKSYLEKCVPIYETYKGWDTLEGITNAKELMIKCSSFIKAIEYAVNVPVTVVSIGSTRKFKIVLDDPRTVV